MKRTVIAAMLVATPAAAKDSVLSCFSQDNKDHIAIVGDGGDARIQWNGGKFFTGTAAIEDDRYLIVKQFGNKGTFRLVYDTTSGLAYGGTIFYDGKKSETYWNCVWQ